MKNTFLFGIPLILLITMFSCGEDETPPPVEPNPLTLDIKINDTMRDASVSSAVLSSFSSQKVPGKRLTNVFKANNLDLTITIENWDWQKPMNKSLLAKTYGKYEDRSDADQCKKIDNVWYCDRFNASYKIGNDLYYVEQDDPNASFTIASFDTSSLHYSGAFEMKMYTIFRTDSLFFEGTFENIPYSVDQ
ncbi:MAG: hypothetical protein VXX63_04120 [Bacteroidota bacterium]|nr:hypothetical protein [Bacteroidota bacterium]